MIKTFVSGEALSGVAGEMEQDLEPLMIAAAEAGADVFVEGLHRVLSGASSKQGGPPARLTGELQDAMQRRPTRKKRGSIEVPVGVTHTDKGEEGRIARKAAALEYGGTDAKGRVHPPYPFTRSAVEMTRDGVDAAMARVLETGE